MQSFLICSCMAGYDGQRGWIYYLAVDPEFRRLGVGRLIMQQGCPKIDLMIRDTNSDVISFYRQISYLSDPVKVMSKSLIQIINMPYSSFA